MVGRAIEMSRQERKAYTRPEARHHGPPKRPQPVNKEPDKKYDIQIPKFAKISNYRTMNAEKKTWAIEGKKQFQLEWMREEANEFYEAISLEDEDEVLDKAIGLLRTAHHFSDNKRVQTLWHKVKPHVIEVLSDRETYDKAFKKWKKKKTLKGQAKGITSNRLLSFGGLFS